MSKWRLWGREWSQDQEGMVTTSNPAIWLVLSAIRIFLSLIDHARVMVTAGNNVQARLCAFESKSEIECKKSTIECKTVKLKMIDSSYFELGQTKFKWRTKILTLLSSSSGRGGKSITHRSIITSRKESAFRLFARLWWLWEFVSHFTGRKVTRCFSETTATKFSFHSVSS